MYCGASVWRTAWDWVWLPCMLTCPAAPRIYRLEIESHNAAGRGPTTSYLICPADEGLKENRPLLLGESRGHSIVPKSRKITAGEQ